ncbi:hypothetical protein BJ684DRAFT_20741 [Piptocephalis cylindrospora]|uniref:Potassium channel domain-containing protein n=1 Tax=Piptocephalis cylindrospora TaxID=1907219 RepID=A0A4P9Y1T2_9FUNG|nr:hypothetical protein BJ684DRAFT_20741 [Piptocephalis cylindrospora]|eukprot:RKP12735.1 hypothetical protein BJ684DRAFT_20741 [Piptocephalis cylindrospora]
MKSERATDPVYFSSSSIIIFSTLLYFAERGIWNEEQKAFVTSSGFPSAFDSIPAAFWFVMTTITTVGFGDMVPTTFIGKLIAFPAMMVGILIIALPSIIVGRNFTIVWELMKSRRRPVAGGFRGYQTDMVVREGRRVSLDSMRTAREYGPGGGGYLPTPTYATPHDDQEVPLPSQSSVPLSAQPSDPLSIGEVSVETLLKQQALLMEQMKTLSQICEENQTALSSLGTILRARRPHGSSGEDM